MSSGNSTTLLLLSFYITAVNGHHYLFFEEKQILMLLSFLLLEMHVCALKSDNLLFYHSWKHAHTLSLMNSENPMLACQMAALYHLSSTLNRKYVNFLILIVFSSDLLEKQNASIQT
jgi:hypothetical protein